MSLRLGPDYKGFPLLEAPVEIEAVGTLGWHVLDEHLPLPLATLRQGALAHNLAWMQSWARRKGLWLAPHAKTTLSPQLMARQLQAGAWGLTVANVHQLQQALAIGATRCIIANQLLAEAELDALQSLLARHAGARAWFLVDSMAQLALIEAWARRRPDSPVLDVLLELGVEGFRTGCRSLSQAQSLAVALAACPAVRLCGVECYEGGLAQGDSTHDSMAVDGLVRRVRELVLALDAQALWRDDTVLLSAGGSAIFDLVVPLLAGYRLQRPVQGVLRSGCYITHDHGHYAHFLDLMARREGLSSTLQPALEVWARVQSVPESGLALLNAGRRDLSHDQGLPVPVRRAAPASRCIQAVPSGWQIRALSDQHAHLHFDPAGPWPQVGERVALGISHPCTTFDKWRWMALVDDAGAVTGAITTGF